MKPIGALLIGIVICSQAACSGRAATLSDPTGDAAPSSFDLTRLDYAVVGNAVEIRLTFAEDIVQEGWLANVVANVYLDLDRTLLTGFKSEGGLHPSAGIDYQIELSMAFGWNVSMLRYNRHHYAPPYVQLEQVQVALGDPMFPNGSVVVVGASAVYGTDNHQALVQVPTSLFSNGSFPVCSEALTFCHADLFPCPLAVTNDARRALVQAEVYAVTGTLIDQVPNQGLLDAGTGLVLPSLPTGTEDLLASVSDPVGDCTAGIGINGEDLVGFKVFLHPGGLLSCELALNTYTMDDTAVYVILLDLDDSAATGQRFTNGPAVLGADLIAEFANCDNPVGQANPLEGQLLFWKQGAYCPMYYVDHLGKNWWGSPGYVFITLPPEVTAPGLAANPSGRINLMAASYSPDVINFFFEDMVPDGGVVTLPVRSASTASLQILSLQRLPGQGQTITFTKTGSRPLTIQLESAPSPSGPWTAQPATLASLGNDTYRLSRSSALSQPVEFFRIVGVPTP